MTAATVNDNGLKGGLVVSVALHVLLLLFLYFGLPVIFTPLPEHHAQVPFEIVEVADLTNTRVEEPKPVTQTPEPPPPPPQPKPAPPQVQAMPEPPKPQELEALKPAEKPKPPDQAKPKTNEDFAKLLKNLETNKKPDTPKTETKADSKQQTQAAASQAPSLSNRLTISEEDLLRRQIEQNWNIPIGARDIQNIVVEIHIDVNPDRTVQQAEIVDKSRMLSDSFYRAVAESALRAVYASSPLQLPADKYDQWKAIDITFSAKDML